MSANATQLMSPPKEFNDIELDCAECHLGFTWTSREQAFYEEKGFANPPKRCSRCRQQRRDGMRQAAERQAQSSSDKQHEVDCAQCGDKTTVPFIPSQGRPVYCRPCFDARG